MAVVERPRWAKNRKGPSFLDRVFAALRAEQAKEAKRAKKADPDQPPDTRKKVGAPKAPEPVRSEPYRRLVATFPCIHCSLRGHSQAAHPHPTGKGVKECDLDTFPLCTVSGNDCHGRFDRYELFPADEAKRKAAKWIRATRARVLASGRCPKKLIPLISPKGSS